MMKEREIERKRKKREFGMERIIHHFPRTVDFHLLPEIPITELVQVLVW